MIIYTRKNPPCPYCIQAKNLMDFKEIEYTEFDMEDPGVRDFFKEEGFKTVPQIFTNRGIRIGGFAELERHLNGPK